MKEQELSVGWGGRVYWGFLQIGSIQGVGQKFHAHPVGGVSALDLASEQAAAEYVFQHSQFTCNLVEAQPVKSAQEATVEAQLPL